MKQLFTLCFFIISLCTFAQESETVKIKEKLDDGSGSKYKVEYYVLKSDQTVKHGAYKRFNIIKDLEETGFYNRGIKEGTWKTYSGGKMVSSEGNFSNGKKEGLWNYYTNIPRSWKPTPLKSGPYHNDEPVGEWIFYLRNGEIEQKYDFSKNELTYQIADNHSKKTPTKIDSQVKHILLDRSPVLIGGNVARIALWKSMDSATLHHLSNGQRDVSYAISFWVAPNGDLKDFEVVKGVNKEYDNYIIEHYKENSKWVPGVLNGENAECQVIISMGYEVKM